MSDTGSHTTGLASGRLRDARYGKVVPWLRGNVLELGCAGSPLPDLVGVQISGYSGCEIDAGDVELLRQAHPELEFAVVDIDHEPLPDAWGPFDTIVGAAVIEHLFNLELVMSRLAARLAPDGRIVLTTPTPLGNDVVLPLTAPLGITSKTAHDDHIAIFNRRRFALLASEVDLQLLEYRRFQMGLNSLAVIGTP